MAPLGAYAERPQGAAAVDAAVGFDLESVFEKHGGAGGSGAAKLAQRALAFGDHPQQRLQIARVAQALGSGETLTQSVGNDR